jgi:hypothetical protein
VATNDATKHVRYVDQANPATQGDTSTLLMPTQPRKTRAIPLSYYEGKKKREVSEMVASPTKKRKTSNTLDESVSSKQGVGGT